MNGALRSAINFFHAREIEPGIYVFQNAFERWVAVPLEALQEFADNPQRMPVGDPRWKQLPRWWKLESRVFCKLCKHASDHTDEVCYCSAPCYCDNCGGYEGERRKPHPCCCDRTAPEADGKLITVDLSTGEEIA